MLVYRGDVVVMNSVSCAVSVMSLSQPSGAGARDEIRTKCKQQGQSGEQRQDEYEAEGSQEYQKRCGKCRAE